MDVPPIVRIETIATKLKQVILPEKSIRTSPDITRSMGMTMVRVAGTFTLAGQHLVYGIGTPWERPTFKSSRCIVWNY